MWPVKKPNGKWRLTIDYQEANKSLDRMTPLVADPSTIFSCVPDSANVFSVIDISNENCQNFFAFTCNGHQFKWTRLPQGFHYSPTVYHQALRQTLNKWTGVSTIIPYVDDILICSEDEQTHKQDFQKLLDLLHEDEKSSQQKKGSTL